MFEVEVSLDLSLPDLMALKLKDARTAVNCKPCTVCCLEKLMLADLLIDAAY
jgi:hypothetical protein